MYIARRWNGLKSDAHHFLEREEKKGRGRVIISPYPCIYSAYWLFYSSCLVLFIHFSQFVIYLFGFSDDGQVLKPF
jgi:hypothetical protein